MLHRLRTKSADASTSRDLIAVLYMWLCSEGGFHHPCSRYSNAWRQATLRQNRDISPSICLVTTQVHERGLSVEVEMKLNKRVLIDKQKCQSERTRPSADSPQHVARMISLRHSFMSFIVMLGTSVGPERDYSIRLTERCALKLRMSHTTNFITDKNIHVLADVLKLCLTTS
jgi:hypothetical protein